VATDEGAKKKATTDEEAKKKARLARFAPPVSKTDTLEEEKRKARMIRYVSLQTVVLHIDLQIIYMFVD